MQQSTAALQHKLHNTVIWAQFIGASLRTSHALHANPMVLRQYYCPSTLECDRGLQWLDLRTTKSQFLLGWLKFFSGAASSVSGVTKAASKRTASID
eukprot:5278414-Amphidinium_carterae.1